MGLKCVLTAPQVLVTEQVVGHGGPPGPEGLPSCTSPQPHSGKGLKAVVELGTPQEGLESCPCGHAESRGPLTSGYLPCGGLSDLLPSVRAELAVKKEKRSGKARGNRRRKQVGECVG